MYNRIDDMFSELAQYKRIADETNAIIASLQDEIKKYMSDEKLTILTGSEHKASYKEVSSSRIDTMRLKKEMPEISEKYSKTIITKRFTFE